MIFEPFTLYRIKKRFLRALKEKQPQEKEQKGNPYGIHQPEPAEIAYPKQAILDRLHERCDRIKRHERMERCILHH